MPRKRRIWHPDMTYHIVTRGNRRDALFLDARDFRTFLYILNQTHQKCPIHLFSYCLMTNHYHLLIQSPTYSISTVMALVNKRYATYFNNRYRLTGHVFEKRFFSEPTITTQGLLEVSRYIHWNPVKARLVNFPEEYEWSSYRNYVSSFIKPAHVFNPNLLLNHFQGSQSERNERYLEYCRLVDEGARMEYLIRVMSITR